MSSSFSPFLIAEIEAAAESIPFDLIVTSASEAAGRIVDQHPAESARKYEILSAIIARVDERCRAASGPRPV